jgi:peptidyl-tRNA hydrolase, PTH1 family
VKLIVGLGNPGKSYANNRHNIGFQCIDYFARLHLIRLAKRRCQSRVGIGMLGEERIILAKPETFVNLSGIAVDCLMNEYVLLREDLLVICDDLDLPLGKIRLRSNGGGGGHNGMRSIISALGTEDFCRIKVGIGRPSEESSSVDRDLIVNYVLGDFLEYEKEMAGLAVSKVSEVIDCFFIHGIEEAMNRFN